ncbi:MAG: LamG-like jellyroll fold domain-containing protein [Verrucomicrobiota bacterium]
MKKKFLGFAVALCGLTLSSHAALVAHYKFNEAAAATLATEELGGTSGVIGSSVVTGVAGISGNAYEFPDLATAAGIVDMGEASFYLGTTGLNNATAVTYSLWMKSTDSDPNRSAILYSGSSTVANSYQDIGLSGEVNVGATLADGSAYGRNRPVGASGTQQTGVGSGSTLIHDGNWHHLAMTIDLGTSLLSIYVDGNLAGTQSLVGGVNDFPDFNNFEIGRLGRTGGSGPTDALGGFVDDVQVYNTALSAAQITLLHASPGTAIPEPGTLALAGIGLLSLARRRRA